MQDSKLQFKSENWEELIKEQLLEGIRIRQEIAACLILDIIKAAEMIIKCYQSKGKVLIFGNGGSAADAQHIAGELVNYFRYPREPLPALALHTDTSSLTAISNDIGYEQIFAQQITAWGKKGDVAVAITTSDCEFKPGGHSANIGFGLRTARALGLSTLGLVSIKSRRILEYLDLAIQIPGRDTPRIQEGHQAVYHLVCDLVEQTLFPQMSK